MHEFSSQWLCPHPNRRHEVSNYFKSKKYIPNEAEKDTNTPRHESFLPHWSRSSRQRLHIQHRRPDTYRSEALSPDQSRSGLLDCERPVRNTQKETACPGAAFDAAAKCIRLPRKTVFILFFPPALPAWRPAGRCRWPCPLLRHWRHCRKSADHPCPSRR